MNDRLRFGGCLEWSEAREPVVSNNEFIPVAVGVLVNDPVIHQVELGKDQVLDHRLGRIGDGHALVEIHQADEAGFNADCVLAAIQIWGGHKTSAGEGRFESVLM
jgi:hypothetical protein